MCDCDKHLKRRAKCTCVCPEHANFQAAYDLAMSRFYVIRDLEERLEQALTAQPAISEEQVEAAAMVARASWPLHDEHIAWAELDESTRAAWRSVAVATFKTAGLTVAGESQ